MSIKQVILVFLIICLLFLGVPGIWGSSEAREGQVIWVLMNGGDWVLPLRNGIVPSKPPLFHWFGAIFANGLGFPHTEFLVRLPSLLAATSILFFTGSVLNRIRPPLATTALVIISLSYGFLRLALDARVDMFFSLFVVLAMLQLLEPLARAARPSSTVIVKFYALCGLAVLAKGPLGLALPGFCGFICVASTFGLSASLRLFFNPLGLIVFAGLALPWYFAAAQVGSDAFVSRQLLFENVHRFLGGEDINAQPVWYYLPEVIAGTFPWCLGLFYLRGGLRLGETENRLVRLCAVWVVSGMLLFSVASGKRASYLLPLYVPIGIILGSCLSKALGGLSAAHYLFLQQVFRGAIVLFAVNLIGLAALAETLIPVLVARGVILPIFPGWLALVLLVLGVAVLCGWLIFQRSTLRPSFVYAVGLFVVVGALQSGLWVKAKLKGFDQAALAINAHVGSQPLRVVKGNREEFFDPLFFYLRRKVEIAPEAAESLNCEGFALIKVDQNYSAWLEDGSEISRFSQRDIDGSARRQFALVRCRRTAS